MCTQTQGNLKALAETQEARIERCISLGTGAHLNPSTWEVQGPPGQHREFQDVQRELHRDLDPTPSPLLIKTFQKWGWRDDLGVKST